MQVYSQSTGKLEALLLDEGILTELRTAAAGALAVQLLLGPSSSASVTQFGMLGSGVQARYQLKLLARVTTCRNLLVYGRSKAHVQS